MMGTSAFLIRSKDYRSTRTHRARHRRRLAPANRPGRRHGLARSLRSQRGGLRARPGRAELPAPPGLIGASTPSEGPVNRATGGLGRDSDEGYAVGTLDLAKGDKAKDAPAPPQMVANAAAPAGAPPMPDTMTQTPMARSGKGGAAADAYSLGAAAYQARNYAEATRQFDVAARTGDRNAELWAAEREGRPGVCDGARSLRCPRAEIGRAVHRQRGVAARGALPDGDGADRCGQGSPRTARRSSTHQQQAQAAMNDLNQALAAKQAGGGTGVHAAAAPSRRRRPPPRGPPSKPSSEMEKKQQIDRTDSAF